MTTAFVDSSAWIALAVQRDSRHAQARSFFRSIIDNTRLMTSNYVLGESLTFLTYRRWRRQAIELNSMIQAATRTNLLTLEWVTPAVHDQAWEIYQQYDDQLFSFCDCTSFALCLSKGADFVFGFDRDFETVGLELRPGR
jgi:hypothetical protein